MLDAIGHDLRDDSDVEDVGNATLLDGHVNSTEFDNANGTGNPFDTSPQLYWLIPGLGLMSAFAVAFYILASHHLKLGLFGLLGYVEPVLLVVVALLLGERLAADDWMTYAPIWLAVGILAVEGVVTLRRQASRSGR